MSAVKNLKWKRSLSTLRFSYEELQYIEEVSAEAALEFEKYYRRFCVLNNIDIPTLEKQNKERVEHYFVQEQISEKSDEEPQVVQAGDSSLTIYQNTQEESEDYQMTADEIAIHEAFSKLFKKLALKLHPDRINKFLPEDEKQIRAKEFKEANEAFDQKKYFFLLDIADKYRVSTPRNYDQQTRWMKRETEKIQQLISKEKNTYNYGFAEAETEEEKELLIRKFIFQLFRINV
tara:strand:+ start:343 stop:1041 length:699 start_codon:yes stop_codon:yes gene_type:complete